MKKLDYAIVFVSDNDNYLGETAVLKEQSKVQGPLTLEVQE